MEVLAAELQPLPPLARVLLVDVDIAQGKGGPDAGARPGLTQDNPDPPVIDMAVSATVYSALP